MRDKKMCTTTQQAHIRTCISVTQRQQEIDGLQQRATTVKNMNRKFYHASIFFLKARSSHKARTELSSNFFDVKLSGKRQKNVHK